MFYWAATTNSKCLSSVIFYPLGKARNLRPLVNYLLLQAGQYSPAVMSVSSSYLSLSTLFLIEPKVAMDTILPQKLQQPWEFSRARWTGVNTDPRYGDLLAMLLLSLNSKSRLLGY